MIFVMSSSSSWRQTITYDGGELTCGAMGVLEVLKPDLLKL